MKSVTVKLPDLRTDNEAFFRLSGYYHEAKQWNHHPLLVFAANDGSVDVQLLASQSQLRHCTLPDSTPCLQQWGGQWRSDFFAFTLGEARAALDHP